MMVLAADVAIVPVVETRRVDRPGLQVTILTMISPATFQRDAVRRAAAPSPHPPIRRRRLPPIASLHHLLRLQTVDARPSAASVAATSKINVTRV